MFFDFDSLRVLDHQYVRVLVGNCSSDEALNGKHGLIEYQYVRFAVADKT